MCLFISISMHFSFYFFFILPDDLIGTSEICSIESISKQLRNRKYVADMSAKHFQVSRLASLSYVS